MIGDDDKNLTNFEYCDLFDEKYNYWMRVELFSKYSLKLEKVLGQSYTNKVINNMMNDTKRGDFMSDAMIVGYPNEININGTYSYIFILSKIREVE